MDDTISRQAAIDKFEPWLKVDGYSEGELNMLKAVLYELRVMSPAQPTLYGYDLRNLIVFADAVNKKGISDSEIEDFVKNARAAWEYAWEEFQRTQKEALESVLRGDKHEG